ncbi:MAG: 6-carboxytetrahydropterin synthase QueD [Chitinispirillaceae bacterium]|nr:6-carboxytetrahydropterin synthase QueD [Chitinispirillaceae bacterium]
MHMYEISVETSFSAAHRLIEYDGPCENLHGHNWLVRAKVTCDTLDPSGLGIDFRILKNLLKKITGKFDHTDLNTILDAVGLSPSSENIARHIFEKLEAALVGTNVRVSRIEVFETPGCCAAYFK